MILSFPPDHPGYRIGRVVVHSAVRFAKTSAREGSPIDQKKRVIVALVLNQILSRGTHLFAKATLTAIGPLATALLRFICASVTLLLFELLRPRSALLARHAIPSHASPPSPVLCAFYAT